MKEQKTRWSAEQVSLLSKLIAWKMTKASERLDADLATQTFEPSSISLRLRYTAAVAER